MEYIFALYIIANSFLSGMYFRAEFENCDGFWSRALVGFICIALIFLAIPAIIIGVIFEFVKWGYKTFQVKFFLQYLFTKRWNNVEDSKLETIRRVAKRRNGKGISDSMYRYCAELIEKRNAK